MRITREMLLKSARDTVTVRIKTEKDLVAAYLVGSVLGEDPLLGGGDGHRPDPGPRQPTGCTQGDRPGLR